jgi:hypothetical protein
MAAPYKYHLDYFNIETNIESDIKIKLINAKFPLIGFAVYIKLLIRIYGGDMGHVIDWTKAEHTIHAKEWGLTENKLSSIIDYFCEIGLFDQDKYKSNGILTSESIAKRYFTIIKKCKRKDRIKYVDKDLNIIQNPDEFMKNLVDIRDFQPPSLPEVEEFVERVGLRISVAKVEMFYSYMQSKDWSGITENTHWQTALKDWQRHNDEYSY